MARWRTVTAWLRSSAGHCLQVNIELERAVIFVDEITAFAEIIVSIDDLVRGHGVGDTLYIDVPALLTADLRP